MAIHRKAIFFKASLYKLLTHPYLVFHHLVWIEQKLLFPFYRRGNRAQRGNVTYSGSHSKLVAELRLEPRSSNSFCYVMLLSTMSP